MIAGHTGESIPKPYKIDGLRVLDSANPNEIMVVLTAKDIAEPVLKPCGLPIE
jgi:hypothetical protein